MTKSKLKRTPPPIKQSKWDRTKLGRTPHQMGRDILKSLLGEIKRVEATTALPIVVRQEDIDTGVQHNACLCPLANAIHRAYSGRTIFLSKIAYVLLPDEHGEERWVRHVLPALTQNFVWNFDHYGKAGVHANVTLQLMPVTPGRTLMAQRAATRSSRDRQVGKRIKPITPRGWSGRRATLQNVPMLAA